jgi:hypothetical protein
MIALDQEEGKGEGEGEPPQTFISDQEPLFKIATPTTTPMVHNLNSINNHIDESDQAFGNLLEKMVWSGNGFPSRGP